MPTICAISTAQGGAIGIVRMSGRKAIIIADRIFKGKRSLADASAYSICHGQIMDGSAVVDDVLVSKFLAPNSYTGENSIEISCHGSIYILNKVLQLLIEHGCRQAEPGEFTKRAFLNGKMDLSQAEAVADLIASKNKATHDIALSQLKGNFSTELAQLRKQLLKISSLIELELDFSEEDVNFADRKELLLLAEKIKSKITTLLHSFKTGKALKEGIPVVIVGKTNVGKSTLLNRLLHDDKAIVSDIHGTTRDAIEDTTTINEITFRFIDTAGLRETDDVIENIGIERTHQKISQARIVLWVIDEQPTEDEILSMQNECKDKKLIVVRNKSDIKTADRTSFSSVSISAKYDDDLSQLEQQIYKAADIPEIKDNEVIIVNTRHYEALYHAKSDIERLIEGLTTNISGDLLAEDLRNCNENLAEITGGSINSSEILSNIFSSFCIGK